jgi:hypothetical protein
LLLRLRGVFVFARCNSATAQHTIHSSQFISALGRLEKQSTSRDDPPLLSSECRNWPRPRVPSIDTDWLPGSIVTFLTTMARVPSPDHWPQTRLR